MKLLEENTGKTFSDINYSNVFLGQSPKATEINAKSTNETSSSFCIAKEITNKTKRPFNRNIYKQCDSMVLISKI